VFEELLSDARPLLLVLPARICYNALLSEYSRDSGVEIQPGDFGGTRTLCKTATRLAKQTRPVKGKGEGFNCGE